MHSNRKTYDYKDYQHKLRNNYQKLGIVCESLESGNFIIFRPVPSCPWIKEGRKKYFAKIYKRLKSLPNIKKYTFCTLTYSRKKYSNVEVAQRIKHDIDLFFKRLGYRKSRPEYFYIIELTNNFMPHIHLIFDRFVHKKKIFKSWFAITGSLMSRIKYIPKGNVFYYIAHYVSNCRKQDESKWQWIFKNIDRVWTCSRKFFGASADQKKLFDFYFSVFDKNMILDKYFSYDKEALRSRALDEIETEMLLLYSNKNIDLKLLNLKLFDYQTKSDYYLQNIVEKTVPELKIELPVFSFFGRIQVNLL